MELNILVYGPKTEASNRAIRAAQFSWGVHATRLNYWFKWINGVDQSRTGIYWVEGDIDAGNYRIVDREFANFDPTYVEKKTQSFLGKYGDGTAGTDPGSPSNQNNGGNTPNPTGHNTNAQTGSGQGSGGNLGLGFGFGLLNIKLPFGLPNWLWLVGAGYAGMKFIDTTDKMGKAIYGAAGAYCTINYLNNAQIPIKLPKLPFIGATPRALPPKRVKL